MDVELILTKLSDMGYIRLGRVINNYYQIHCPFHNNGQERRPSFGVLLHSESRNGQVYPQGWCHCFTCGYVNPLSEMITDILKSKNISSSGLEWLKTNIPGFEIDDIEADHLLPPELLANLTSTFALNYIRSQIDTAPKFVPESELQTYRYTVPYMYERKLTDAIIEQYDIGVDMKWIPPGRSRPVPCLTFPVHDKHGNTLFICRRSIQGKLYNYPTGVTKTLFGIDKIPKGCKSLIICESCINALTCVSYGYAAVALLGTGNSIETQQLKELGMNEFILCFDGDEAGEKATAKFKRQLSSVAIVWAMHMPAGKDANDCTKAEFDKLYAERD